MSTLKTVLLTWLALIPACGFAQLADTDNEEIRHQFVITNRCETCHKEPGERDAAAGITERVRLREWVIWKELDKHASAYKVLTEPRSQRMGQLLGKDVLAAKTGCIQCHTSNFINELWAPECFQNGENVAIGDGVSCQTCHGPAELWEGEHYKTTWREKSHAEKAEFGFNAMEDPVARASMCTSCHIGSAKSGRVITHEMYAAGHPMLSGFDMEAFADKMPRHWRYAHEKPGARPFSFDRTRAVLIGSVVALKTAVDLANDSGESWPELARLECFSCHHELKTPSWRQENHAERFLGRPRLEVGCLPLVRVAAQQAMGPESLYEFDVLVQQTREPFANNLFGDPAKIADLRTTVDEWSLNIEQKLADLPLDEARVREILDQLLQVAGEGNHDFDTARQLTGAIYVIAEELSRSGARVQGLPNLLTRLKALEDDEKGFALVSSTDKRVEDKFHLQLANRARFKPAAYSALLKSLLEGMKN